MSTHPRDPKYDRNVALAILGYINEHKESSALRQRTQIRKQVAQLMKENEEEVRFSSKHMPNRLSYIDTLLDFLVGKGYVQLESSGARGFTRSNIYAITPAGEEAYGNNMKDVTDDELNSRVNKRSKKENHNTPG